MQKIIICKLDQIGIKLYEEVLKRIQNNRSDINKIINMQNLNLSQINELYILFTVNGILTGEIESVKVNNEGNFEVVKEKLNQEKQEYDEQPDTSNVPELESKESAEQNKKQRGLGLKILTPN